MSEHVAPWLVAGGYMLLVVGLLAAFIFPWVVAVRRKHPDSLIILLINFLVGFSGIGWTITTIWALSPIARPVDAGMLETYASAMSRLKALSEGGFLTAEEFGRMKARYLPAA